MATTSGFSALCSICGAKSHIPSSSLSTQLRLVHLQRQRNVNIFNSYHTSELAVSSRNKQLERRRKIVRSVAEETRISEESETYNTEQAQEGASTTDQPVSVPVSPSDALTMFFQAEGTMNETVIPTLTSALEAAEGINDLKVQVSEGIASVELKKLTTVQATGVASNLVEIIQGSGFKLHTLNLSFEDGDEPNGII